MPRPPARFGKAGEMPVAIERPDGRLLDLLEAEHPVVPVKPSAIKAWRDGEVPRAGHLVWNRRRPQALPGLARKAECRR